MKMTDPRISIQASMRAAFPEAEERVAQFYAMQQYQLGWYDEQLLPAQYTPGKLLRPQLTLLSCMAVGGDPQKALPLAAGIQLMHDFSLVHDDIEDQSSTRRGRPTTWTIWGLAHGINIGDAMLIVAHLALHRLTEIGVVPEVVLEILRRFDQTILTVCEGQYLDISYEGDLSIKEADYFAMISRKTAALVAASAGLGAIVGGADAKSAHALFEFGENLGLAFQIQDDILGIWGDPTVTGKPAAADLYRRKLSLPIIHTLNTADQREALVQLYQKSTITDEDAQDILRLLNTAQAQSYTESVADFYHQQALESLDQVQGGNTQVLASLREQAQGLLHRRS
ncbi:MAG: polyprenyl synthetase family protein [Chloroflexi bacterium AL-W]|nr:polyprenyl synthetase family protein [Chloroflexi bacterium AL-N1]NOK71686.1 polyprenyl synthetase family protein [Chloroflexi bacterium AL-N10]NOK79027.1 polyprenyl synthetase family protein [Chloroflexi bacterium AL-N5]NOK86461.1 polyprenyl synthetase family protein [Chloroflexi bacterium AL-W]NOK93427.1 polyprenyl synthetase family protein [Chloroflexi bacterium AL-N15]